MSGRLRSALVLSAILAAGCWQLKPNHCDTANDCASHLCNMPTKTCVTEGGAGGNGGAAGNGGAGGAGGSRDASTDSPVSCIATSCSGNTPICPAHDGFASCEACTSSDDCKNAQVATGPACVTTGAMKGSCVPCVDNTTCAGTTPICDTATNTCTKCVSDSDCAAAPGVCMGDGHCASAGEVIFVQYSASGCPTGNGTMATPYCTLQSGATVLASTRNVIIVVGPANDQLTLATSGFSPVIIGRADSSMTPGSIPAIAGTAITVSSDNVAIRNLLVNVGTGTSTKGILVKGNGTKLSLTNVTVSLTNGLGIDAEAGATLTMNRCTVSTNKGGGILLNGAAYDIEESTVTGNGPATLSAISWGGVLVNALPTSGSTTLKSLTITNNLAAGLVCASSTASGTVDDVLVSNNTTGNVVNCGSGISTCGDAGTTTCGAQQ